MHPNYCALVSLMNLQVEEEIPRAAALALSGKGFLPHMAVCSGQLGNRIKGLEQPPGMGEKQWAAVPLWPPTAPPWAGSPG